MPAGPFLQIAFKHTQASYCLKIVREQSEKSYISQETWPLKEPRESCVSELLRDAVPSPVKSLPCPRRTCVVSPRSRRGGSRRGREGFQLLSWWTFTPQSCAAENRIRFRNQCKCIIFFTKGNASCQARHCPRGLQVQKWKIVKCQ